MWSDHRPVSAILVSEVRIVDEAKRQSEFGVAMKELDKLEEAYRPSLEVTSNHVDCGDVRLVLCVCLSTILTIAGIECLLLRRSFSKIPEEFRQASRSSRWVRASRFVSIHLRPHKWVVTAAGKQTMWLFPCSGVVEADKGCILRIVVLVDAQWAPRLTLGEEDLNGTSQTAWLIAQSDQAMQMFWYFKFRGVKISSVP